MLGLLICLCLMNFTLKQTFEKSVAFFFFFSICDFLRKCLSVCLSVCLSPGCYVRYHGLGAKAAPISFSWFWRPGGPASGCRQMCRLLSTLFLGCGQLTSFCVFTWGREPIFLRASFTRAPNPSVRAPPS